tara:strand:+ start:91 stop:678 length:588 start_codon:yes stop_codon:yes gene_type:complete
MKNNLRKFAKNNRSNITFDKKTKNLFNNNFYTCLDNILSDDNNITIVGLYYPILNEISPLEFVKYFQANEIMIALPVVNLDTQTMLYIKWDTKKKLKKGILGNMEPTSTKNIVMPEILIVPMLLFDRELHRLGYGGGYYDKAICKLKKKFDEEEKKFISIGLAYSEQETIRIPYENHDERLDFIITEKEIISKIK